MSLNISYTNVSPPYSNIIDISRIISKERETQKSSHVHRFCKNIFSKVMLTIYSHIIFDKLNQIISSLSFSVLCDDVRSEIHCTRSVFKTFEIYVTNKDLISLKCINAMCRFSFFKKYLQAFFDSFQWLLLTHIQMWFVWKYILS